ncbi:POU domain class 2-associating factor 1 [Ambystoma mexicanum]|uniref:POU domain class 2-associating factor 1 n=1 Tax=Ambystoma mexicanum TaxID=8296 RepID=UPI0037E82A9C
MHWQTPSKSDPQPQRPYQGVRVKEPVKELLKRKRGNLSSTFCCNNSAMPAPTVILPHQPISGYSTIDPHCLDLSVTSSSLPITDDGGLYTGWITQPSSASLQPLTQWATCTDYIPHEAIGCPFTGDMYVQPMCPSYTVVGPSSVLTYTSQPLLTNFMSRNTPTGVVTPLEFSEQHTPVTYFQPYYQSISTLPAATLQYQAPPSTAAETQLAPFPFSVPDPTIPQQVDEERQETSSIAIEKLLQPENEENENFVLKSALSLGGF